MIIAPTVIKIIPIIEYKFNFSPKKIAAKTNANTMLNRSIGTTCLTVPNFKARK